MKPKPRRHPFSHAREVILQSLYQLEVGNSPLIEVLEFQWLNEPLTIEVKDFCKESVTEIAEKIESIDKMIDSLSTIHSSQISEIVRCILRMGVFELFHKKTPPSALIDDLIELTKKYDSEESVPFVNAILDRFQKEFIEKQ